MALLGAPALAQEAQGQAADLATAAPAAAADESFTGAARGLAKPPNRGAKVPLRVFPQVVEGSTVLFDNGPFVTHPGGGGGGADASALQTALGMLSFGYTASDAGVFRLADDFTVVDAGGWDVDTVTVFCYQTGSPTTSTFDVGRLQIWDGDPAAGGVVIFGDTTTNRMLSTAWTNAYRVTDTTLTNTQRPIMEVVMDVGGFHLDPGTYWIDFQTGGTLASGPFCPPVTILGQTSTGDGKQWSGAAWVNLVDVGPQGIPFVVEGSGGGPEITLAKTVDTVSGNCGVSNNISVDFGTPVTYCYTVTNTGSVALNFHTVVDDQLGTLIEDFPFVLSPGNAAFLTVDDVVLGATTTNNATWTASESVGTTSTCNGGGITIPDSGPGVPYPSQITVAGAPASPTAITVALNNMSHTWPDDIDVLLVGPGGQNLVVESDVGGSTDIVGVNILWDDAAAGLPPDGGPLVTGSYQPSNVGAGDTFDPPAPAGPHNNPAPAGTETLGSIFGGLDPNGTWDLYLMDGFAGDSGSIGEWCVEVTGAGGATASASDSATVTVLFPDVAVDPTSLSSTLPLGGSEDQPLDVENNGLGTLDWSFTEAPPPARAPGGLVFYTDRPTFEAENPGLPIEDFEDTLVAPGAVLGCPAPFDATTNNACFAPGGILPGLAVQDNPLNDAGGGSPDGLAVAGTGFAGSTSDQVVANTFIDSYEMVFVPPVTAVGGELVSYFNPDTVNIEVFDENDVSLGTTTAASSPGDGTFWGVASSVPIGRINMLTPTNQAEGMDNVTFGSPVGCSSPEDLPWISVAPDSGSTAPMSTTPVTVSFSAGVLPPGTYDGLLCLDSNDPDTPTLEVPVSLTVDSMPFLDGFETGDTSRWTLTIP